jgi:amidase
VMPATAPFDVTGHPAMSVPCGMGDGLPIAFMLVGKHYDESTIYRAAAALKRLVTGQRCKEFRATRDMLARFG